MAATGKHTTPGRHAGPARLEVGAPSSPPKATRPVLLLALGITAAVVAWGYLVYLAIDFGTAARDGDAAGWWLLALATIGAIACLFVGMLLGMRFVTRMRAGTASPGAPGASGVPAPPRPPGGRRIAR